MAKLVDYEAIQKFRKNALNPEHPVTRGTAQNTVKRISVLDRIKEPGALGEPLYQDVCTLFCLKKQTL